MVHSTYQKEDSPVKTVHRVIEVMLTGCISVFKGVITSQTLTAITTQSSTLKGSRLQKHGYISASILACMSTPSMQSNSDLKSTPRPQVAQHSAFYRVEHDVMPEPVMSQICHGMTSPLFHVMSYHDITS